MLELREYELDNELNQNDEVLMDDFMNYDGGMYISDAITEIADSNVSCYNYDICENTWGLYSSGAYEEASGQGLLEGSHDLIQNLQTAWYVYNSNQLYNNLDTLIFNYAVNYIIDNNLEGKIDIDDLEDELLNLDEGNTFDDIIEVIHELVEDEEEDEE